MEKLIQESKASRLIRELSKGKAVQATVDRVVVQGKIASVEISKKELCDYGDVDDFCCRCHQNHKHIDIKLQ